MFRRVLLGGLAAGALPFLLPPAWAQQDQPAPMPGVQPAPAERTQNLPALPRDEQTMLGGMAFARSAAGIASTQAQHQGVLFFARLEDEEQNAFAEARRVAGLAVPDGTLMDQQKRRLLQQLQGTRGADFDRLFVQAQVQSHQELLQLYQAKAGTAENREEKMLAMVALPAIRSHLAILNALQQQVAG